MFVKHAYNSIPFTFQATPDPLSTCVFKTHFEHFHSWSASIYDQIRSHALMGIEIGVMTPTIRASAGLNEPGAEEQIMNGTLHSL